MRSFVSGSDNSSEKEDGFSLHVDLGSAMWKATYRVRVLLKLHIKQHSIYLWIRVNISIDRDLGEGFWVGICKKKIRVKISHRAWFVESCSSQRSKKKIFIF